MSVQPGHSDKETHLAEDGTPDMRFKENGGGSHGNQGGRLSGGFEEIGDGTSRLVTGDGGQPAGGEHESTTETYKPSEHNGFKKDGISMDQRMDKES